MICEWILLQPNDNIWRQLHAANKFKTLFVFDDKRTPKSNCKLFSNWKFAHEKYRYIGITKRRWLWKWKTFIIAWISHSFLCGTSSLCITFMLFWTITRRKKVKRKDFQRCQTCKFVVSSVSLSIDRKTSVQSLSMSNCTLDGLIQFDFCRSKSQKANSTKKLRFFLVRFSSLFSCMQSHVHKSMHK